MKLPQHVASLSLASATRPRPLQAPELQANFATYILTMMAKERLPPSANIMHSLRPMPH